MQGSEGNSRCNAYKEVRIEVKKSPSTSMENRSLRMQVKALPRHCWPQVSGNSDTARAMANREVHFALWGHARSVWFELKANDNWPASTV